MIAELVGWFIGASIVGAGAVGVVRVGVALHTLRVTYRRIRETDALLDEQSWPSRPSWARRQGDESDG